MQDNTETAAHRALIAEEISLMKDPIVMAAQLVEMRREMGILRNAAMKTASTKDLNMAAVSLMVVFSMFGAGILWKIDQMSTSTIRLASMHNASICVAAPQQHETLASLSLP